MGIFILSVVCELSHQKYTAHIWVKYSESITEEPSASSMDQK